MTCGRIARFGAVIHEALTYGSDQGLADVLAPFVRDGVRVRAS